VTGPGEPPLAHDAEIARLEEVARRIRVHIVRTVNHARGGHLGGPLSAADILAALYFRVLRIRPDEPDWPDRDRFVLSKGHSSVGLYAALALRGFFPVEELATFDALGSRLQGHPDMNLLPGLDMSTGSLGMGISAGVGMALGARLTGLDIRTYVLLGDGECQEGEVWEAAFVAARYGLDRLIAIVDHNKLQQYGWQGESPEHRLPPEAPGELVAKWAAFGWRVIEVDGHDMAAVVAALEAAGRGDGRPTVLIAHTVKGRGVSFMEGKFFWHTRLIKPEEFAQAMAELGEPLPQTDGGAR
jgi:transketolase